MSFCHYAQTEGFCAKQAQQMKAIRQTLSPPFAHRLLPFFHRPSLFIGRQWPKQWGPLLRLLLSPLRMSPSSWTPTSTLVSSWSFPLMTASPTSKVKPNARYPLADFVIIQFHSHFDCDSFTFSLGSCFSPRLGILSNGLRAGFSPMILELFRAYITIWFSLFIVLCT